MNALQQLEAAPSRWENEGGPRACTLPPDYVVQLEFCGTMNTELEHLHVRMIAMENLLITLLTQATEGQRDLCREMARYISPRPGFTAHSRTLGAAAQMLQLVERAERLQGGAENEMLP